MQDYSDAFYRVTRVLANLNHTERTELGVSPQYTEIMEAVVAGNDILAQYLIQGLRSREGDRYRAKLGVEFLNPLS